METYFYVKSRFEVFYELMEMECREKGWEVSFDKNNLYKGIDKINGHKGSVIHQYPDVAGKEIILCDGWWLIFDHGYALSGDISVEMEYSGNFYNPNGVEYPFHYESEYLRKDVEPVRLIMEAKFVPSATTEEFIEIMRSKVHWVF